MLKVEILRSFDSISKEAWDKVLNASPKISVFQTFGFQKAWWNNFGRSGGKSLLLLTAKKNGEVVGIAPLFVDRVPPLRVPVIRFIGSPVADYMDFISVRGKERETTEAFYGFIKKRNAALTELIYIPDTRECFHRGLAGIEEIDAAPYIDLCGGWDAVSGGLDKRLIKDLARCERNLSDTGAVLFGRARGIEEAEGLLNAYFEMHIRRWKERAGRYSQFQSEVWQSFVKEAMGGLFGEGSIDLSYLKAGDRFIAFHFGYIYEGRFYYYMPSYDPDFYRYSPSKLLIKYLIKDSCDAGLKIFDFLRGKESYKLNWTDKEKKLFSATAFSDNIFLKTAGVCFKGGRDLYARNIKPNLKRIGPLMKLWYKSKSA